MTQTHTFILAALLTAACDAHRPPAEPLPEWGEKCGVNDACAEGLECNTSEGVSQLGYCSEACSAAQPCSVEGEVCNSEGACTNPCTGDNGLGCPLADVRLQCVEGLCVGS